MVHMCIVCKKRSDKEKELKFHGFPSNANLREQWKRILKCHSEFKISWKVCSDHFKATDYLETVSGGRFKLNSEAVPSVKLGQGCQSIEESMTICKIHEEKEENDGIITKVISEHNNKERKNENNESNDMPNCATNSRNSCPVQCQYTGDLQNPSTCKTQDTVAPQACGRKRRISECDKYIEIFGNDEDFLKYKKLKHVNWDAIAHDPVKTKFCWDLAVEQDLAKDKIIKGLRQEIRTLKSKVSNLKGLTEHLKSQNFLSSDAAKVVNESVSDLGCVLLQKILHGSKQFKTCPSSLQRFASTLHFLSPKAYDYIRENLVKCLPHPSTIRLWFTKVDGTPGISKFALAAIKSKVTEEAQKGKKVFGGIQIDDMAIKQGTQWIGEEEIGYVDWGGLKTTEEELQIGEEEGEYQSDLEEAKHAAVIMFTCVNGHWKIPVAYYLISSMKSVERAKAISQVLHALDETGVEVVSLTFDGTATNFAMANSLGAKISHASELRYFFNNPANERPIFLIPDACHMLKLVRNCFGTSKQFYRKTKDGDVVIDEVNYLKVEWKFLELLVNLQSQNELHAANKLSKRHLNWQDEKMKVCLAAQTLSSSVANALKFLREVIENKCFEKSEATEEFCRNFDEIFDILNSRQKFCKDSRKQPISEKNINVLKERIAYFEEYIRSLYVFDQKRGQIRTVLETQLKTGFSGFIIALKSVVDIFETWCNPSHGFEYLLTYKLSQDHLELLFSAIRSRSGSSNNPTVIQIISSMKRILVHACVGGSKHANVLAQDGTCFLHVENITNSNKGADDLITSQEGNVTDEAEDKLNEMCDNFLLDCAFDNVDKDYVDDVIAYIAGFVVKKIMQKISCGICVQQLHFQETQGQRQNARIWNGSFSALQMLKDRGGLTSASKDVVDICKVAEAHFKLFYVEYQKKFRKKAMNALITKSVYSLPHHIFNNAEHMMQQGILSDHRLQLLKLALKYYFVVRIRHHICAKKDAENQPRRIRHKYTKLILFQNQ